MSVAVLLRGVASVLDAFGPDATDADMDPAIGAVVGRASPEARREAMGVIVGALDRLQQHPTPAQGAADLRRLADEIDPSAICPAASEHSPPCPAHTR